MKKYKYLLISVITAAITLSGCEVNPAPHPANTIENLSTYDDHISSSIILLDKVFDSYVYYPYMETDERTFGVTATMDRVDFEALCGMREKVSGNKMNYSIYAHNSKINPVSGITLAKLKMTDTDKYQVVETLISNPVINQDYTLDTSKLDDGLYMLKCDFEIRVDDKSNTYNADAFFVKSGSTVKVCRITKDTHVDEKLDNWHKFMKNVKPENNLKYSNLTYPGNNWEGEYNALNDVKKIVDNEILTCDAVRNGSDAFKVYVMTEWFRKNIAYDQWKVNNDSDCHDGQDGISGIKNPENWLPRNHTGVCADFTNVAVMMCRYMGIPACAIDDETRNHMWFAVYLYGEWVTFDLNETAGYECSNIDVDSSKWKKTKVLYNRYGNTDVGEHINSWHLRQSNVLLGQY